MTEELPTSELGTKEYWKDICFDIWTASSVGDIDFLNSFLDINRTETESELEKSNPALTSEFGQVCDLDFKNSGGWTCLMYAAYYDHPNIVRWLLEGNMYNEYRGPAKRNPVNPLIKNRFGKTSLMLASSCGHNESVETILNCCKTSLSAKHFSALLEEKDQNDFTALFHSASSGHCSTCILILEYGANVNTIEKKSGYTPLIWAAAEGHDRVVEILISFGADINYQTVHGVSAISAAHRYGRINVVARLSSNVNTKLMGIEYNSSAKHFQVPVMPKAIIHYESEHIRADKNRSDTIGLKLNEKVDGLPNSLPDLLKELGLQKYAKNFFDADVDNTETFKTLTDDDLKEKIGIILIGPRRKLTTAINWDKAYTTENENFDKDGLEGEVWFGEESTDRIMRWLDKNKDTIPTSYSILDLGCGNGQATFAFLEESYSDVIGVDYSEAAIQLSNKIARQRNANVIFKKCDILSTSSEIKAMLGRNSYDVCFDKGTYDAISLSPEDTRCKRQKYIDNISVLLQSSTDSKTYLILTSCNWTKEELAEHFKEYFDVHTVIPTPQFKFGGVVGNNVTSVIFERKL